MRRRGAAALLVAVWLAAGCGEPRESLPALEALSAPALDEVDDAVRELLAERTAAVRRLEERARVRPARLAATYGALGDAYLAYDFDEAASPCYANATRLDAEPYEWWYALGLVRSGLGAFDDAAVAFERALERRPEDLLALVRLADVERQRRRPERSHELLERVLAVDPANAVAHNSLGQLASAEQNWARAAHHYEQALALQPAASSLRYPLAIAYQRLGRLPEAREQLVRRGTGKPSLPDPLLGRLAGLRTGGGAHRFEAVRAMRRGDLEGAIREFTAARDADPDDASVRLNLGAALARANRLDEARPEFEAVLELDARAQLLAKAHTNLAVLDQQAGRPEEARRRLAEALRLDPGNELARRLLAEAGGG